MKQVLAKKFALAALVVCAAPVTLLAQPEKETEKAKDKTERQQIIITRTGDKAEKTVIEIEGDKVKVNGKDVADAKDVRVSVNNWKTATAMGFRTTPGQNAYSMVLDDNNTRLFKVDSNRAMLGVVTEEADNNNGAKIQSITKESAAEKAGLKKGDVITKVDNRKIDGPGDISDAISSHKPGDKVSITYLREGKEQKAATELGRWKGIDVKSMTAPKVLSENMWRTDPDTRAFERFPGFQGTIAYGSATRGKLGLGVQDTDDGKGVKVINVDSEGAAAKSGLKQDDVITHIDDKAVNGADEIAKLMKEKKDQPSVRFQVVRGGKSQSIDVRIPRKLKTVDL